MTVEDQSKASAPGGMASPSRRRMWRWVVPALAALAVGGVLWSGARRAATGAATGEGLSGAAAAPLPGRSLRVGVFNIHGGVGRSGKLDLGLTADSLRGLDLVGLNEVHGPSLTEHRDQAEILGEKLGASCLFLPTETRWWREDFGNGVLCRTPVKDWARLPLPKAEGHGYRNVTLLNVPHADRTLHVLVTHLDLGKDRPAQFRVVKELFLAMDEPAILMGDLNCNRDDPLIQELLAAPGVEEALDRLVGEKADRRRSWILTRGLKCLNAGVMDQGASDHTLVWAELEVPS